MKNPRSGLTKKDIKFFLSGISPNDYFIRKLGVGKYKISADRYKHINQIANALSGYYRVTYAPTTNDGVWIIVEGKIRNNPRRLKSARSVARRLNLRGLSSFKKIAKRTRKNCGCKRRSRR